MRTDTDDSAEETDDEFRYSRPPRRESGCPACGAPVTPSPTKEVWPRHPIGGEKGAEDCALSGVRDGYYTDVFFRRFIDRDTPPVDTGEGSYYKFTDLERFGTAIGVLNTVYAPSEPGGGAVVAQVRTLITQADYPRFRAELDKLAAEQGWDK